VAAVASAYAVQMAHHEEPQISAQLLSAVPHGTYLERFYPDRDPFFWRLIANRSEPRNGIYHVPDGPGFGVVLDWDYVASVRA
jgi:D-galactarolactone cycloisomerase